MTVATTSETTLPSVVKDVGAYVAVRYDGEYFPGMIVEVQEHGAKVKTMIRAQKTGLLWKWPEKEDVLFYYWVDILRVLDPPVKFSSTRATFTVSGLPT